MWQWFHRLGSPRWFYQTSGKWLPWLGGITFLLLIIGLVWGLGFAPRDAKQGNSFRIIYIHVPASFLALAGYYVMAIAGAVGLIWKMKLVGMVNIPIIYKSVDWWYTLHQPATIKFTEAPTMHPDMFHPLLVMIVGFYCFYALVLILNTRSEILHRERRSSWVKNVVLQNQR